MQIRLPSVRPIKVKCRAIGLAAKKSLNLQHGFQKFINSVFPLTRPSIAVLLCALTGAHTAALARPAVSEYADTVMSLPSVSVTYIKSGAAGSGDETATTIGQGEIERLNIVNIKQASEIAPNFYMPQYGSRMTASVYVRGLGTRIDQPVVGLNVDNVPIINKDNFDFDMADITRIEILRGPQNILYGRNTMGGLINISTLSPLSFEGVKISAEYGTHNTYKASAGIYRRLRPSLGMALNIYATGTNGFYRNTFNNSHVGKERQWNARWKTQWRPTESLMLENTASVSHSRQNGYPYESAATGLIAYNDTCFYKRLTVTDGLTAKGQVGNVSLSGIASFQYINDNMTLDQDFLPLDYFTLTQRRHEFAFTADVVASGRTGSSYKWLAGAFGFVRRSDMEAPVTFFNYGLTTLIENNANSLNPQYPVRWDQRSLFLGSNFVAPTRGVSVYHESTLDAGPWTVSLGLRLDTERAAIRYHSHSASTYTIYDCTSPGLAVPYHKNIPIDIDDRGELHKTFTQVLPKLSVSYTLPSDLGNIFASVTKGYKAGGYNTQMFSDVLQQRIMGQMGLAERYDVDDIISYAPEKTWNYEIGAHLSLLNHRLQLDVAAFWIECRDQQLTMFPEGSVTGRIMANAGRSRSRGLELSAMADLPAGFSLRASYGMTDARFTDFNNGKSDFSGSHVPYAPLNTLFASAGYRHAFRNCLFDAVSAEINTRGVGDIYWNEDNTMRQPFYMLAAASVKADIGDFSAELWADNITDTRYATFYFVSIGNAFLQRGNGFACGVTLRYQIPLR